LTKDWKLLLIFYWHWEQSSRPLVTGGIVLVTHRQAGGLQADNRHIKNLAAPE